MVKKIHKMVLDDPRLKVRELADMVGISKNCCTSHIGWKFGQEEAVRNMGMFTYLKRMLQGKRFGSNEEVFAESEAYF